MKAEYVNRLLDSAQRNLDAIPENQRMTWVSEMDYLIRGEFFEPTITAGGIPTEDQWNEVLGFQKDWLRCLNWLFNRLDRNCQLSFVVHKVFQWGARDKDSLFILADKDATAEITLQDDSTGESITFPRGSFFFMTAVNGYGPASFRRCADCGKLFYAPTKKRQAYCSPACQKRAGMKRLRQKDAI